MSRASPVPHLLILVACICILNCIGCAPTSADLEIAMTRVVDKVIGDVSAAATATAKDIVLDQGVLESFLAKMAFTADDPTLIISRFTENGYKVAIENADVEMRLEGGGTGTFLPAGTRQALIDQLGKLDPTNPTHAAAIEQILTILGWNRDPDGGGSTE